MTVIAMRMSRAVASVLVAHVVLTSAAIIGCGTLAARAARRASTRNRDPGRAEPAGRARPGRAATDGAGEQEIAMRTA
jgi:hypothetical protein